jgi:hypothetical protein
VERTSLALEADMISDKKPPKTDTRTWLLTHENPGVRYLALRDLFDLRLDDPELIAARRDAHACGPIADVLAHMHPDGYWVEPGPGYNPKYRSTVWSIILLAELGARVEEDERISRACSYLLDQSLAPGGQFGSATAPSGTADCLQGNLCWAITELGYDDPRIDVAFEWMARTVTGEGLAPMEEKKAPMRFYAGKCGPLFACGANNKLSCAWGGAKVMQAFSRLPVDRRSRLIETAIQAGAEFFLDVDPATAAYPSGYANKPSGNWWKFGFPVFYISDILQIVEALVALGYGQDPRLENALTLIREKQDHQGRWPLEFHYTGKTWIDFGQPKQPNPWVTLRALRTFHPL